MVKTRSNTFSSRKTEFADTVKKYLNEISEGNDKLGDLRRSGKFILDEEKYNLLRTVDNMFKYILENKWFLDGFWTDFQSLPM